MGLPYGQGEGQGKEDDDEATHQVLVGRTGGDLQADPDLLDARAVGPNDGGASRGSAPQVTSGRAARSNAIDAPPAISPKRNHGRVHVRSPIRTECTYGRSLRAAGASMVTAPRPVTSVARRNSGLPRASTSSPGTAGYRPIAPSTHQAESVP